MGAKLSRDRGLLTNRPTAGLQGPHSSEAEAFAEHERPAGGVPEQAFVPDVLGKPSDIEDSEEREPLNVKEAAAALPHWRQQVDSSATYMQQHTRTAGWVK